MKRNYHSNFAFLDLLFNTLLCFVALFAVALLVVNPDKNNKKIDIKAEFIITATWPKEFSDDIDLYVQDPVGNIVYFKRQEAGLMHLDRDDLGSSRDRIQTEFGVIEDDQNREMVTIRGITSGQYIVNIHAYHKVGEIPVPVKVSVDKINPFGTIVSKTIMLESRGQEETVCRFILNSNGDVVSVNQVPKAFTGTGSGSW
jgi:hypothetical protein